MNELLDEDLVARFSIDGWVQVPNAIDDETVRTVRERLDAVFPTEAAVRRDPDAHRRLTDGQFGGLRLWPLNDIVLDLLPMDDSIIAIAESLLEAQDLRLLRAGYQMKYADTADFDQVLHFDYPNHSLVVPADNDIVGFFLYLSDVTADLGPTMIASDTERGPVTPGATHRAPADSPGLYAREVAVVGTAGDLLAYRSTTFHRGSAMTAKRGTRLTLGFAYGRPAPWTGYTSFPRLGEEQGLINAIVAASPRQRELLGFPPVDSSYWNERTIAAVAARYAGIDVGPYAK